VAIKVMLEYSESRLGYEHVLHFLKMKVCSPPIAMFAWTLATHSCHSVTADKRWTCELDFQSWT
jgi:hypothetical protein